MTCGQPCEVGRIVFCRVGQPDQLAVVAATALGAIHGAIGLPQQVCRHGIPGRKHGNADGHAHLVGVRQSFHRQAQRGDHFACHGAGACLIAVFQQDGELITADTHQQIVAAHRAAQALGDQRQHPVANHVAVDIVDRLEAVQIGKQQGALARYAILGQRFQLQFQKAAVGQVGQRVAMRQLGELAL